MEVQLSGSILDACTEIAALPSIWQGQANRKGRDYVPGLNRGKVTSTGFLQDLDRTDLYVRHPTLEENRV